MKGDFSRQTFDPEKHYSGVLLQQGRVQLDADWNEQVAIQAHRDRTTRLDLVGAYGAPAKAAGFEVRVVGNVPRIGAGRYYVEGVPCENEQERALAEQPDFPGYKLPTEPGLYVAYLRVWERHVTAIEDPAIREPALGGPDTASRTRTVWQVDLLRVADNATGVGCGTNFDRWTALTAPPTGRLRCRGRLAVKSLDPCLVPPGGGYSGPENRLYRVEIHEGGPPGKATFKWSRDNGSVVAAWEGRDPEDVANLFVGGAGPGGAPDFAPGDWVELSDDRSELQGRPGTLVRVRAADGRVLAILPATATGSSNPADFPEAPKVRRWDSPGQPVQVVAGDEAGWIPLEDGVEVKFEGASFNAGDYWLIPARTATGDVEWPREEGGERKPLPRPPHGVIERYCRLGLLTLTQPSGTPPPPGVWTVVADCRRQFPPLAERGVRVIDVRAAAGPVVRHDLPLPAEVLAGGFRVECEAPLDPASVSPLSCYVTLNLPVSSGTTTGPDWGTPVIGFQPLIVAGTATVSGRFIVWAPTLDAKNWIQPPVGVAIPNPLPSLIDRAEGKQVLGRLTLRGNFLWAADDPTAYLDGETFGARKGETPTGLRLPGGDGRRGGDFEIWFWLTPGAATVTPTVLNLSAASVTGGVSVTGTVVLNLAAPAGGAVVGLSSSQTAVAVVPASVTVAAGQTSSPAFTVTTQPVAASTPVTITATLGGISQQRTLSVEPTRPQSVSLTPPTVVGGAASSGTVTLTGNAPAGGAVVNLSSSQPAVASVPASVTVAAGAKLSPAFSVTTQAVGQPISVTITASRAGVSQAAVLAVQPAQPAALSLSAGAVTGGVLVSGTVTLSGPAPAGGAVVNLNSSHPAAPVPASVLVPEGQSAASFTVATQPVSQSTLVAITASRAGVTQAAMLTVNPPPVLLSALSLSPTIVSEGGPSQGTVTLTAPAPAGGVVVNLSSDSPAMATVPATVTVPGGQTTATFTVGTRRTVTGFIVGGVIIPAPVTITAVCGNTKAAILTVRVLVKPS